MLYSICCYNVPSYYIHHVMKGRASMTTEKLSGAVNSDCYTYILIALSRLIAPYINFYIFSKTMFKSLDLPYL